MRRSLLSIAFGVALLSECYAPSAASPMGMAEDGPLGQEAFTSLLNDQAAENGLGDADLATVTKSRLPRVIVIAADPTIWRDLQVLRNGLSTYKRTADENSQATEQSDVGQHLSIPILRRNTMRCMVGRVYRPCWEV
ncbi:unnamed protein product [Menidia menidia]|uniref:(Atlantic silverside) hypothetical protein n=1 Tax=Menidia menidia TaxID=238744 RepID=A0A8S4ALM5_9TELE|nr:unnamed protein product [Menidia menidia]